MALTKKRIERELEGLIVRKNGYDAIRAEDVDLAIKRITGSFTGSYAMVEKTGAQGQILAIGNLGARVSKPLVKLYIREDI